MSLMESALWNSMMNTPVSMDAANDGITIVLLLIATIIIVLKPDFSKL